jgi:hypothetical protein
MAWPTLRITESWVSVGLPLYGEGPVAHGEGPVARKHEPPGRRTERFVSGVGERALISSGAPLSEVDIVALQARRRMWGTCDSAENLVP